MGNTEQGSLSYHLLMFVCLAVIGSSDEFSTSLPSRGYHIGKASKCIHVLGMVRAGQPKPFLETFVMFLAFELRTSSTTKACQNPQGKSGVSSLRSMGHVLEEVQARQPFFLPALERKQTKIHFAVYCFFFPQLVD